MRELLDSFNQEKEIVMQEMKKTLRGINNILNEKTLSNVKIEVMEQQIITSGTFVSKVVKEVSSLSKKALIILEQQVFSQRMVENLINDLLDLAKLQNSSFQLN